MVSIPGAGHATVTADQMFISYGTLQFLNKAAVEPTPIVANDEPVQEKTLVKAKKKTKWTPRQKMICVRAFSVGSWSDVRLEE